MLHPSYSELMTKINAKNKEPVVKSRYSIVMGTAKRARQLVDKGYMELEDHSRRPLSIAVEELYKGDIHILTEEETEQYRERYAARMAREAERLAQEAEAAREAAEAARQAAMDEEDEDEDDEEDLDDLTEENYLEEETADPESEEAYEEENEAASEEI